MPKTILYLALFLLSYSAIAHSPKPSNAASSSTLDALRGLENAFFQAWEDKQPEVFRQAIRDDGIFFGQYGVSSKSEEMESQEQSKTYCEVQAFQLTDFTLLSLTKESAVITYRAEQHATCGGKVVDPLMNGLSVYVKQDGKWMNVVRLRFRRRTNHLAY